MIRLPKTECSLRRLIMRSTMVLTVLAMTAAILMQPIDIAPVSWSIPLFAGGYAWLMAISVWFSILEKKQHQYPFISFSILRILSPGIFLAVVGTGSMVAHTAFVLFRFPIPGFELQAISMVFGVGAFLTLLIGMYLFCVIAGLRKYRAKCGPNTCTKCNYDLRGTTVPRCPECGTPTSDATPPPAPLPGLPSSSAETE